MLDFSKALQHQLETDNPVKIDEIQDKNIEIQLFNTNLDRKISVLCTSGLSNYSMPINEKEGNAERIELCFALPHYWDLSFQQENASWVVAKLKFLSRFVLDKNTHFWDGHTIPNSNPNKAFSASMKQENLLFCKSLLYPEVFSEVQVDEKTVHLLFLIPLFKQELDYKQSRGTTALKKKMNAANLGEILDDFRTPVLKKFLGLF